MSLSRTPPHYVYTYVAHAWLELPAYDDYSSVRGDRGVHL